MMGVVIVMDNTFDLELLAPDKVMKITYQALNRSARWARTLMDREVRKQTAFPASYLRPSEGRLTVNNWATEKDLEVSIRGRDRPTSLSRFLLGRNAAIGRMSGSRQRNRKAQALRVAVKPGSPKAMRGAFLVKLRGDENGNIGLAMRMRDGNKPSAAYHPTPLKSFGPNVWLLYGPSVDQVLWAVRNNGGVFAQVEDEVADKVQEEFDRLIGVEMNRG